MKHYFAAFMLLLTTSACVHQDSSWVQKSDGNTLYRAA